MSDSFHHDVLGAYKAGDIVRQSGWHGAFADAVVLGFNDSGDMKIARPYVYASCVGTTAPMPLTGVEMFTIPRSQIGFYEHVVGEDDGHRRV